MAKIFRVIMTDVQWNDMKDAALERINDYNSIESDPEINDPDSMSDARIFEVGSLMEDVTLVEEILTG